jgi:anti-anti-sigma regulatory factor
MRSDTLDIIIEERNGDLWCVLSGPFSQDQIPTFREKFITLVDDGNRSFVIDLERVGTLHAAVIPMFLQLINILKAKNGNCKFVFSNEHVTKAFHPYRHIITAYPDASLLLQGGLLAALQRQRRRLSRKTGIRISRPVALILLFVLCGWFISLLYIIHLQNRHIKEQQSELHDLSQWETRSRIEIENMRNRLQPLEQLGILRDSTGSQ